VPLILEEFLLFQVGLALRRRSAASEQKPLVPAVDDRVRAAARAVLPFALTAGQRQALADIVADMVRPAPMQRLLQGDVGAGKTIVALLAAVVAMENGLQVALMAPTEILAEQHYLTVRRLLAASAYQIALLTGAGTGAQRRHVRDGLASGRVQFVVGTHALVQEAVAFSRLGLVVVDEQHRFGVLQRAVLRAKGWNPDVLVMTATPIPRTLALTLYGDLDVSVIRGAPPRADANRDAGAPAVAQGRGARPGAAGARRGTPGLHRVPARGGVVESRRARRDGDGRPPGGGGLPGVPPRRCCTDGCARRRRTA